MKIMCIDVGRGTQDILLYDSDKNMENCVSLIIPSRGILLEKTLFQIIARGETPLFWGTNMGGFPALKAAQTFIQNGGKILATPSAAKTFKDDLQFLKENGFKIISEEEADVLKKAPGIVPLETKDIDWDNLEAALCHLGEYPQIEGAAVAVQDHGEPPKGIGNRQFRFAWHKKLLEQNQNILEFSFIREQIPEPFTRMRAAAEGIPGLPLVVMDTGWAAILGALDDPWISSKMRKLIVNAGNAHTLAAFLDGEEVCGIWEHHTGSLTPDSFNLLLEKLIDGSITNEDVFDGGGHGAYVKTLVKGRPDIIALCGPNRMKFYKEDFYLAAPHGNMMLTGSFGLLRAYKYHFK